jgi:hypothetical protein
VFSRTGDFATQALYTAECRNSLRCEVHHSENEVWGVVSRKRNLGGPGCPRSISVVRTSPDLTSSSVTISLPSEPGADAQSRGRQVPCHPPNPSISTMPLSWRLTRKLGLKCFVFPLVRMGLRSRRARQHCAPFPMYALPAVY